MLCGNFYNMTKVLQNKIENTFFKTLPDPAQADEANLHVDAGRCPCQGSLLFPKIEFFIKGDI